MEARVTRRWSCFFTAAMLAAGCSEESNVRTFTADSGARDTGPTTIDAPVTDTGLPTFPDAGGPVDRPVVRTNRDILRPGVGMEVPGYFDDGEASSEPGPTIVYPQPGTIIPPNLPSFEVHWRPSAGSTYYEVAFQGNVTVARVFTRCTPVGGGCTLTLAESDLATVAMAARGNGELQLTVRGVGNEGGAVLSSAPQTLGVSATEFTGGVYWWASSGSIVRYEFGRPGAQAELFLRGDPFNCVGCHSLSRDGTRIAAGRFIPAPAPTQIIDVATRGNVGSAFGSNFGTFSPDSRWYLSSDGQRMTLVDAQTGAVAPTGQPPMNGGSMPDWSPMGDRVVYSRSSVMLPLPTGSPGHSAPADLMVMPWAGGAFGAPTVLVQAEGFNNYYPSFSPDAQWVLFNRAAGESYDNRLAELWIAPAGGGAPQRLTRADDFNGVTGNSWPKFTPVMATYEAGGSEPLMWFTFSSRRDYGLRLRQSGEGTAQLWMAAFRPNRVGTDMVSAPAFWLPFQNMAQGNHIAQWVTLVRRQECGVDMTCGSNEFCVEGRCVGAPP